MTTQEIKGTIITSPDLQQRGQKADSALHSLDRETDQMVLKLPFASAKIYVLTAQKEQSIKKSQLWWFPSQPSQWGAAATCSAGSRH